MRVAFMSNYRLGGAFCFDEPFPADLLQSITMDPQGAFPLLLGKKKDLLICCGKLTKLDKKVKENIEC